MRLFRGRPDVERLRRERDVAGLVGVLGDGDAGLRAAAANALVEVGDARAVGPLAGLLSDPDAALRLNGLLGLGALLGDGGPEEATAAVRGALGDAEPRLRALAALTLARAGAHDSVPALEALDGDADEIVRGAARIALRSLRA